MYNDTDSADQHWREQAEAHYELTGVCLSCGGSLNHCTLCSGEGDRAPQFGVPKPSVFQVYDEQADPEFVAVFGEEVNHAKP